MNLYLKTFIFALLTMLSGLCEKLAVLFSQEGVKKFSDISQVTYASVVLTSLISLFVVLLALFNPRPGDTSNKQSGFVRLPMLVLLAGFAALLLAGQAKAIDLAATWTAPTTRENNDPLPIAEVAGYEISYTVDTAAPVTTAIAGGNTLAKTLSIPLAGRDTAYKIVVNMVTVDTKARKSSKPSTATVMINVPVSAPTAPTLKIVVDCKAGQCTATVQ